MDNPGRCLNRAEHTLRIPELDTVADHTIDEALSHYRVPGLSLAVVRAGAVVDVRAYGIVDHGKRMRVDRSTRFQACSVSKPIAVLGMLRLVADGVLDLDRDIEDYLTSWKPPVDDRRPAITLRQLASHRAGLTVHGFPGYGRDEPLPELPDILDGLPPANTAAVRVERSPGSSYSYSGGGTTVMQLLLEDVTGRPFAELMNDLVLKPIGMADSSFAQPAALADEPCLASGHDEDGRPLPGGWQVHPEQAAAGLWTTAGDLARALVAVQRSIDGPGGIIPVQLARETLGVGLASASDRRESTLSQAGVGFFTGEAGGARYIGHTGANRGFRSLLLGEARPGVGIAVMTNADNGGHLVRAVTDAVADAYGWPGGGEVRLAHAGPATTRDPSRRPTEP